MELIITFATTCTLLGALGIMYLIGEQSGLRQAAQPIELFDLRNFTAVRAVARSVQFSSGDGIVKLELWGIVKCPRSARVPV